MAYRRPRRRRPPASSDRRLSEDPPDPPQAADPDREAVHGKEGASHKRYGRCPCHQMVSWPLAEGLAAGWADVAPHEPRRSPGRGRPGRDAFGRAVLVPSPQARFPCRRFGRRGRPVVTVIPCCGRSRPRVGNVPVRTRGHPHRRVPTHARTTAARCPVRRRPRRRRHRPLSTSDRYSSVALDLVGVSVDGAAAPAGPYRMR